MSESRLSVIIPVYNAAKTIGRCLDSILVSVKDADVEIICVDDGSKDNTLEILQRYMAKFSAIRVFHKTNSGVGSARNMGLEKATGDYIAWVDSDDYVTDDWYDAINQKLKQYHPDCLFFDYFYTYGEVDQPRHIALPEDVTLRAFVYEQSLERELKNFLFNQVIRVDILKQERFNETYYMLEDYDVLTHVTPKFQTLIHINRCLYHYVQTEISLTHNVSADVFWNNITVVKTRYDIYTKLGLPISSNAYLIQLVGYLYSDKQAIDLQRRSRTISIKKILHRHWQEILNNQDIPLKLKVKALCAMIGAEFVLRPLLKIKQR